MKQEFIYKIQEFLRDVDLLRHQIRNFYVNHFLFYGRSLYAISGLLSLSILILEYGFYYPMEWLPILESTILTLITILLVYEIFAFMFTDRGFLEYLSSHKIEFTIIALVIMQNIFSKNILEWISLGMLSTNQSSLVFLSITQVFFLFSNLSHLIRNTKIYEFKKLNPSLVFITSFAGIILVGTFLLFLPKATRQDVSFLDTVFIATSATCVTGLATIDISQSFTRTGHVIILFLMQAGGLGLMTLTSFFGIFLTGKASVSEKLLMKDLLSEDSIEQVRYLLIRITGLTFVIEILGVGLMYWQFPENYQWSRTEILFYSIFHSVSSFCNAGFSLFTDGFATEEIFQAKGFLSISMVLIILGGLGFPVLSQIIEKIFNKNIPKARLSVSARLVLIFSGLLMIVAWILTFVIEYHHSLKELSLFDKFYHSLFYAVTMRTAGFNTIDIGSLGVTMAFLSLFYMWVGASPVSTGGGVKTSTFAVAILNIWTQVRGKDHLEIFKRRIANESVSRASATITLSLFVIFTGLFFLTITEKAEFLDLAFETVSAYSTVGLSRGITGSLSEWGKLNLTIIMFMGRVGVFNIALAIVKKTRNANYVYPNEYVVIS